MRIPPASSRLTRIRIERIAALLLCAFAAACAPTPPAEETAAFSPASFADLPGWAGDDHAAALAAFRVSCPALSKRGAGEGFGGAAVWADICSKADAAGEEPAAARAFFEANFVPVRVTAAETGKADGLFTGYYEPELNGARKRNARHSVPIYVRPPELVTVDLGRFLDDLKGKRVSGRVVEGRLVPFADRAAIERGALRGRDLELVWVDSAADAFFLHIQGSGRIRLSDGSVLRVGYADTNGHVYTAIGRALIENGAIPREEMSMQAIRAWLAAHPAEGAELMRSNRSFVFFRELTGPGPIGALGVALTPGRSLAVDRALMPMGVPVWLDTVLPDSAATPFRRLMAAQDTGGAIRGAVRGDVFWGPGDEAADRAGRMKSPGRYWFLRPRAATPQG